jgi:glycosyltransferase involved in cell wall biosynthesis
LVYLSIITVNLNNLGGLQSTLSSVWQQRWQDFEIIVIDGGSTDGSVDYIKEFEDKITYWVSEPDAGIYDAMNKGIEKARGEYLYFLNSGDALYSEDILNQIFSHSIIEDILYGNTQYVTNGIPNSKFIAPNALSAEVLLDHTLNHQSVFFNRRLFENNRYNTNYKYLADWVFYTNAVVFGKASFKYIDLTIVNYDLGGFSSRIEANESMEGERLKFYLEHKDFYLPLFYRFYREQHRIYNEFSYSRVLKWILKWYRWFKNRR